MYRKSKGKRNILRNLILFVLSLKNYVRKSWADDTLHVIFVPQKAKIKQQNKKTARAMNNVSKLSLSLRRKTDGSPHSVAQTYWIKKDVSPLFRSQKTAKLSETPKKKTDERPWFSTDCFSCSVYGLLGGTSGL